MIQRTSGAILERCREFVISRLPSWRALFRELIRIPSPLGSEHAIVERVARHIESLGITAHRIPHDPHTLGRLAGAQPPLAEFGGRHSLVARLPGTGGGRSLAINTHLDVVPAGIESSWTHPPYAGFIDETKNVIYGRGAMDDKAGVTISLAVLETLKHLGVSLPGDVLFQFVLEDETTGNGSLLILNAGFGTDAAMIMDGTRPDRAIKAHAGNLQFDVKLVGKPASVAVSHVGVNAAEMMARLLLRLRDAVFRLNETRSESWRCFPSPFQLSITRLESVGELLSVPELATAECHMTFPPPSTLVAMRALIEREAAAFAAEQQLPFAPEIGWKRFATEPVEVESEALEDALQVAASAVGMPPIALTPSTGTSDLRHFAARGTPCFLYGPGSGYNPHRHDEHYYLDDLPKMILFYVELARGWCSKTR